MTGILHQEALLSRLPGPAPAAGDGRQPLHTVYGGAHLFRAGTARRFGDLALDLLARYAPTPEALALALGLPGGDPTLASRVRERLVEKLRQEPVEDFRIDFEDGYGERSDEEEDGHCRAAAAELAAGLSAGTLPPFVGIRLKPLTGATGARAFRTLELFLAHLAAATGGALPDPFLVTLAKVEDPAQAALLVDALERLEAALGLPPGSLGVELMVETPLAIVGPDGTVAPRRLVEACRGRCRAAHFGAYDYMSACGVSAPDQSLGHPACDFARQVLLASLSGAGVFLSDGATAAIPAPVHRGEALSAEQDAENEAAVRGAWRAHFENVDRALRQGLYQGWDLHPGHLVARFAAVQAFFLRGVEESAARLRHFAQRQARATRTGAAFDDMATGRGLLNFFVRALDSRALTEAEVEALTDLPPSTLRSRALAAAAPGR